jgi:Xaa-Pro dipeptidase
MSTLGAQLISKDPNVRRFSDEEYLRRYGLTHEWMMDEGLTALLFYGSSYGGAGIRWLTNFYPRHDTYLIWPLDGEPTLLTQLFNHVPNAQRVSEVPDTRWAGEDSAATAADTLEAKGIASGRVGLIGKVPFRDYATFVSRFPKVEWKTVGKGYTALRLVKSEEEMAWLQEGADFTDQAVDALIHAAVPGVSESELCAAIEAAYTAAGGDHGIHFLSSTPMDAPKSYVPAQTQSSRRLEVGDVVISELSAGVGGYAGQIQRPIAVGQKPTANYQHVYEVALETYQRILDVLKPGATTEQVLDEADLIEESGLTVCDDLLHGYGLGYLAPVLRTRATANKPQPEDFVFEENMAVVIQPNVYDPDTGAGLQVGNLVRITREGAIAMQKYPMGFYVGGE